MQRMTTTRIEKETKPGVYRCDPTLYLRIYPGGSKSFVQKLTLIGGKRIEIGLGGFAPRVTSLEEIREVAFKNRRLIRDGLDPRALKRAEAHKTNMPTFAECAEQWFGDKRPGWKATTADRLWRRLERYVFGSIGERPVSEVDQGDVLGILTPIFRDKHATGKQVRQAMSSIFSWAVTAQYRSDDPAGPAIAAALPAGTKATHRAAIKHSELNEALAAIDATAAYVGAALAIRLIALTAVRSNEALGATWSEIDIEERSWTVPAKRMKTAEEHRIPLSDAALAVLREARKLGDGDLVFPRRSGGGIGDRQLRRTLEGSGLNGVMTVHGLRSTFRDWAGASGASRDVAEAALAHRVQGVEGSYFRSDLFDRRRALMESWASYLSPAPSAKVVSIR